MEERLKNIAEELKQYKGLIEKIAGLHMVVVDQNTTKSKISSKLLQNMFQIYCKTYKDIPTGCLVRSEKLKKYVEDKCGYEMFVERCQYIDIFVPPEFNYPFRNNVQTENPVIFYKKDDDGIKNVLLGAY